MNEYLIKDKNKDIKWIIGECRHDGIENEYYINYQNGDQLKLPKEINESIENDLYIIIRIS